jgi:hypothetical protein
MYRCHGSNISTWLDGKFMYRIRVWGEIPCTSTRVRVHAKYSTLLRTMCILVAKGRQVIGTLEAWCMYAYGRTRITFSYQGLSLSINGNALRK